MRAWACFPWTDPDRFISLRDQEDRELALVEDPGALDASSRQALELCAGVSRLVFEIRRIISVEKEHELRVWRVETAQGPRHFQTKLDDRPRALASGGWVIRDVAGDLFFVRDLEPLGFID